MGVEHIFAQSAKDKMKSRIKLQGFIIFLAVAALIFYSRYLLQIPQQKPLAGFLQLLGVAGVLSGFLLRIAARGYKAQMNPDGKTLVTKGPYALMRNPMYSGTLLIGLGIILVLFRWWVSLIFLIIYLCIYLPQINQEERILANRFPEAFKDYCKTTPKFFPSIANLFRLPVGDSFRLKFIWIKKELPSLIITFAFIVGIQIWQDIKLSGYINYKEKIWEILLAVSIFFMAPLFGYAKKSVPRKN